MLLSLLCLFAVAAALPHAQRQSAASVFQFTNWTDTSGNSIQAHGGGFIAVDNYFYWFGENKTGDGNLFKSVTCYRSTDLASWEFRGNVLTPIADTNISSAMVVERPKVVYNAKNSEYVMWFHNDDSSYGSAMVGVATSETVDGTYTWQGSFKPFGTDSRDMTVWKDTDGTAYIVFASDGNKDLKIASLDDDYYGVATQEYIWTSVYWEAPGFFKVNGTYYLLFSRQNGWMPADNYYMTATSMAGPWSAQTLLSGSGEHMYNTQNAFDIQIAGRDDTLHIYYGDRWDSSHLGASSYMFLPAVLDAEGNLTLPYVSAWTPDVASGTYTTPAYSSYDVATLTLTNSTSTAACTGCDTGTAAVLTAASDASFVWAGAAGTHVIAIKYAYGAPLQNWMPIDVIVDGVSQGWILPESTASSSVFLEAAAQGIVLARGSNVTLHNTSPSANYAFMLDVVKVYAQ
ncbi:glycosyl hydrolase [Dipodascopsis tothii]|uniref:glycosyl hydrolase n=1 Tax=Dipodascopsis tothii TaxID=44089 RepID=UPI0034CFED8C